MLINGIYICSHGCTEIYVTIWCDSITSNRYSAGFADVQERRDIYAIIGNQTVKDGSRIYPLNFIDRSQRFSGLRSSKKKKFHPSCIPPWALLYWCLRLGDLERNSDSSLLLLVLVVLPQYLV